MPVVLVGVLTLRRAERRRRRTTSVSRVGFLGAKSEGRVRRPSVLLAGQVATQRVSALSE